MKQSFTDLALITLFVMFFMTISFRSNCSDRDKYENPESYEIRTPLPKLEPRINGPLVYGCRPGNPFLYRIPCQGKRPIRFSATGLPKGLTLNSSSGIITGKAPQKGEYIVTLKAVNEVGRSKRQFKIVAGEILALTPPMGWNSWYCHEQRVTDKIMREAADKMIESGMSDVGYQYVNIDGCWNNSSENNPRTKDPLHYGPLRDKQGNMVANRHFPDMKDLTDYIHSLGLKAGIYSSPGELCCANFAGSYKHEEQDASLFFADWGFDFLKYDWCGYNNIVQHPITNLEEWKKPYKFMGDILKRQPRDVVFNLCQYGNGNVWEWGANIGAQSWRTAGDISFEYDRFFEVALKNSEHGSFSKPGSWNDPDYLCFGRYVQLVGGIWTPNQPCLLTPDEQYSQMSLWCLMAAPLIFGGDMTQLDEFTLNVLCNPEVIDIDQDPLGECGQIIRLNNDCFLMVKSLVDGAKAIGLFNQSKNTSEIVVDLKKLKISGRQSIRDLWRQKELGIYKEKFSAQVPPRGVFLIKIEER